MATMTKKKKCSVVIELTDEREYRVALSRTLSVLNLNCGGAKDAAAWINTWLKQHGHEKIKIPARGLGDGTITWGCVAKASLDGFPVSDKDINRLREWITKTNNIVEHIEEEQVTPSARTHSIQDSLNEKASGYISELEHAIDTMIELNTYDDGDAMKSSLITEEIGAPVAKRIREWATRTYEYFKSVEQDPDKETKQAHKHINVKKLNKILTKWITELTAHEQQKKANRKPIKRKPKPPAVQVKSLKFMKSVEIEGKNIESVTATSIIGADQLWVLNTKTRKLSVFHANDRTGLQVRGSSIQNYDAATSETKTIGRNMPEVIDRVLTGGKIVLRKLMTEIKAKAVVANGRLNEHCILLRTV